MVTSQDHNPLPFPQKRFNGVGNLAQCLFNLVAQRQIASIAQPYIPQIGAKYCAVTLDALRSAANCRWRKGTPFPVT
jgi:hypothetical protein